MNKVQKTNNQFTAAEVSNGYDPGHPQLEAARPLIQPLSLSQRLSLKASQANQHRIRPPRGRANEREREKQPRIKPEWTSDGLHPVDLVCSNKRERLITDTEFHPKAIKVSSAAAFKGLQPDHVCLYLKRAHLISTLQLLCFEWKEEEGGPNITTELFIESS